MRRWFLIDGAPEPRLAPIFLGLAETEAAIRQARHVTFIIHPHGRLVSAAERPQAAWMHMVEGRV